MNAAGLYPHLHRYDFAGEVRAVDEREPIIQNMAFDGCLKEAFDNIVRCGGREMTSGKIHIFGDSNSVRITISVLSFKGNTLFKRREQPLVNVINLFKSLPSAPIDGSSIDITVEFPHDSANTVHSKTLLHPT